MTDNFKGKNTWKNFSKFEYPTKKANDNFSVATQKLQNFIGDNTHFIIISNTDISTSTDDKIDKIRTEQFKKISDDIYIGESKYQIYVTNKKGWI